MGYATGITFNAKTGSVTGGDNLTSDSNQILQLKPDKTAIFSGAVTVDEHIYHDGDADTYIQFDDDRVRIFAGADLAFDYDESGTSTLGLSTNGQADITFGGGNVFFGGSQGSYDGRVGIGTTAPESALHIYDTSSGEVRFQRVTGYTGLMRFGFPSGTPSIRTSGGFQIKGSDAWGADLYLSLIHI